MQLLGLEFRHIRVEQDDDRSTLLAVIEYKPPHKLSVGTLRIGSQEMNMKAHLAQFTLPDGEEARAIYDATEIAVAIAAQTFHYMIRQGLQYSYISTGDGLVFFHLDWDDTTTLF